LKKKIKKKKFDSRSPITTEEKAKKFTQSLPNFDSEQPVLAAGCQNKLELPQTSKGAD
jgi:hypothetical protein